MKKKQLKTKTERLADVVEWLKSEKIIKNRRHLMELIGYKSESQFSSMMNGQKPVPERFLVNLANLDYRLNSEWLRNGDGKMLKDEDLTQKILTKKRSRSIGSNVNGNGNSVIHNCAEVEIEHLWDIIHKQQASIDRQQSIIDEYRAENRRLMDIIIKFKMKK